MNKNASLVPSPHEISRGLSNPKIRDLKTVIPVIIISALMVLLFLLRIYSRMFVTRSLGWDDCKSHSLLEECASTYPIQTLACSEW